MIKLLVMDVDGTLTDGVICIGEEGEVSKNFDVKDGYAISKIRKAGCETCILTSRNSTIVANRAKELNISWVFQNVLSKKQTLTELVSKIGITIDEVAYIGDDINDLDCINLVRLSGCPFDSIENVKQNATYVCNNRGGRGAVREFIDYLVKKGEIKEYYDL